MRKFIICVLMLCSAGLQAQDLSLNVEMGLEFPTYFGMHTKISPQNSNVYARLGIGFVSNLMLGLPGVSTLMSYLSSDYESRHIDFAFDVINNSLYGSLSVGYRMKERQGPYAELGYSVIHKLGVNEYPLSDVSSALGQPDLIVDGAENPMSQIRATLHNGTVHAGYMFPLSSRVSLSTELGLIKPLYVSVSVRHGESDDLKKADTSVKKIKSILGQLWMVTGSLWLAFQF